MLCGKKKPLLFGHNHTDVEMSDSTLSPKIDLIDVILVKFDRMENFRWDIPKNMRMSILSYDWKKDLEKIVEEGMRRKKRGPSVLMRNKRGERWYLGKESLSLLQ